MYPTGHSSNSSRTHTDGETVLPNTTNARDNSEWLQQGSKNRADHAEEVQNNGKDKGKGPRAPKGKRSCSDFEDKKEETGYEGDEGGNNDGRRFATCL